MAEIWVRPDRVFDGGTLRSDCVLQVSAGRVVTVSDITDMPAHIKPIPVPGILCPGFVDVQVNGGGGVLLNLTPTIKGIQTIARAHRQFGTTAIMPTVITDAPEVMVAATKAAIDAKDMHGIVGLHIEGPHIDLDRRGTHSPKFVRSFDDTTIACVNMLAEANVRTMVTLSPRVVSPEQIGQLVDKGVIVSLGHTDATLEEMQAAFEAGANCATHLFNAMSPMLGRAPGAVGAVISSTAYSGIICDGHHIADEMVGIALRARPVPDRMFLVSDAMPTVGGPEEFELYGKIIALKNGRLENSEGGLAGAHVTQAQGVQRLIEKVNVPADVALRMAITVPATLLDMPELAQLSGQLVSDVLVLNDRHELVETLAETCAGTDQPKTAARA